MLKVRGSVLHFCHKSILIFMKITKKSRKYFGSLNFLKYKPMRYGRPKGMLLINNFLFIVMCNSFNFHSHVSQKRKKFIPSNHTKPIQPCKWHYFQTLIVSPYTLNAMVTSQIKVFVKCGGGVQVFRRKFYIYICLDFLISNLNFALDGNKLRGE